jgi:hypothetical protein
MSFKRQARLLALHSQVVGHPLMACKFFLRVSTHVLMKFGNGV